MASLSILNDDCLRIVISFLIEPRHEPFRGRRRDSSHLQSFSLVDRRIRELSIPKLFNLKGLVIATACGSRLEPAFQPIIQSSFATASLR